MVSLPSTHSSNSFGGWGYHCHANLRRVVQGLQPLLNLSRVMLGFFLPEGRGVKVMHAKMDDWSEHRHGGIKVPRKRSLDRACGAGGYVITEPGSPPGRGIV